MNGRPRPRAGRAPALRGARRGASRLLAAAALALIAALALPSPALAQRFGKNKVTYHTFDWHVYKAPHFDIYYYPEEEAFLEQVVSYAESAYVMLSQALEHEIQFRIPLIYYKTHGEFEQTNITLSFIPQAVGAFAEPIQKRIVLPIDLPPDELYALITHELTHIFEYSILFQDTLGREVRGNPPLWLMEGLAEHLATKKDSFDVMFLRDAVINGDLPTLEDLDVLAFLTYRYGSAIFDFISEQFGKEGLRNFLLEFRKVLLTHNIDKAIKEAFGWDVEEFERRFHRYLRQKYLPALLEKDEPADYGVEIAFKTPHHQQRRFWTFSPAISPSGELVAALTTRYEDLDVAIFSAKDGEMVRNLTPGFTTDYEQITYEFLKGKKDLAWSPDGDRVAFFARKGARQPLFIYHAVTGRKLQEIPIDIDKLASPAFSPDGSEVAFSGNKAGVVDIFAINLKTRQVRNLTQDEFYDSNPCWSADGKQVLYNRRLQAYEKIFMVDAHDPAQKTQLTFGTANDIEPSFSADGKFVYYASDYGPEEIFNIYSLDLADGTLRRYTNVVGGNFTPVELGVDASGKRTLAFASFFKGRTQIYKMTLGEPLQVFRPGQPPEPPEPRKIEGGAGKERGRGEQTRPSGAGRNPAGGAQPSRRLVPRWRLWEGPPAAARFGAFELTGPDRFGGLEPDGAPSRPPENYQQNPAGEPAEAPEVEKFEPPLKLTIDESEKRRYTKKKWTIDGTPEILFGVADDGTVLSDSSIIFSDLLGDYRHFIRLRSVSSFTDTDYVFMSLKRRHHWAVHAFDSRDYYVLGSGFGGVQRRQARRTTGGEFSWRYPFSVYHRVDFALGAFDRSVDFPVLHRVDLGGGLTVFEVDFLNTQERFPVITGKFTGDTTLFRYFGPYAGRRYDLTVQWAPTASGQIPDISGTTSDAGSFFEYFIDWRDYWHWSRRSLFATRLYSAVANGRSNDIFAFGGFNTLRGFDFRQFFGTRVAFMNLEIRFPLVDELRFPFGSIRQIRGVIFFDIGAGWFGSGGACDPAADPDPSSTGSLAECGVFADGVTPADLGKRTRADRRVYDSRLGDYRRFDFWDSKEGRLKDGRASTGVGFSFYFGPFELNWVFSRILPYIETNPFDGSTDTIKPSGYRSAFYIGRKF